MRMRGDQGYYCYGGFWTKLLGLKPRAAYSLRRSGKGPPSSQREKYFPWSRRYHEYAKKDLADWLKACRRDTFESTPRKIHASMIGPDWHYDLPGFSALAAAKYLGVTERTLRRWRNENRGPAYYVIGQSPRYAEVDLAPFRKQPWLQAKPE